MDIFTITSKQIKDGELKTLLPEFYELKKVVENGPWHNDQNTFDHAVAVFAGLEQVLDFRFLDESEKKKADHVLSMRDGNRSRRDMLVLATILHDIAKPLTIIKNDVTKATVCPGHELIGSFLAKEISDRFGLDEASNNHVVTIVRFHGFIHEILTLCLSKGDANRYFELLRNITRIDPLELLLIAYADMLGSDLLKQNADAFEKREKLIITQIKQTLLPSTSQSILLNLY